MRADNSYALSLKGRTEDCEIKNPTRCDTSKPQIVKSVKANTTCPDDVVTLVVGETYKLDVKFTPEKDAKKAKSVVVVYFLGMKIPVHITDGDACDHKGIKCPLKANQTYDFEPVFEVKPRMPISMEMKATLSWSLVDENKEDIFCTKVEVLVKPKPKDTIQDYFPFVSVDDSQREMSFREVP
nr:hypothetical protein BaRGS_012298 [Batillaria attramentaria]